MHEDDEWNIDIPDAPKPKRRKAAVLAEPRADEESQHSSQEHPSLDASSSSHASTSSSGSSTSSSDSDDFSGPPAAKAKPNAKPKAKAEATPKQPSGRNTTSRVPVGFRWLMPRYNEDDELVSWFMRCTQPGHNIGNLRCTEEFSVKQAGGSDQAQRMLKA